MADMFYITGTTLRRRGLQQLAAEWARNASPRLLTPPRFAPGKDGFTTHIFAEGSIRGFLAAYTGAPFGLRWRLCLTLYSMASHADWRSCYSFLRAIIAATGGVPLDGDGRRLDPAAFTAEHADRAAEAAMCRAIATFRELAGDAGGDSLSLDNPNYSLRIPVSSLSRRAGAAQLARQLEQLLIPMAARYQTAHVASIVHDGARTVAAWPLTPTIIADVDQIVIPGDDVMRRVPLARTLEILGRRVEEIQDAPRRWYFPAMNLAIEENRLLYECLLAAGENL